MKKTTFLIITTFCLCFVMVFSASAQESTNTPVNEKIQAILKKGENAFANQKYELALAYFEQINLLDENYPIKRRIANTKRMVQFQQSKTIPQQSNVVKTQVGITTVQSTEPSVKEVQNNRREITQLAVSSNTSEQVEATKGNASSTTNKITILIENHNQRVRTGHGQKAVPPSNEASSQKRMALNTASPATTHSSNSSQNKQNQVRSIASNETNNPRHITASSYENTPNSRNESTNRRPTLAEAQQTAQRAAQNSSNYAEQPSTQVKIAPNQVNTSPQKQIATTAPENIVEVIKVGPRKSTFGFFGGLTLSSFHQSDEIPVNPFTDMDLIGYEAGLHLPLRSGKFYESKLYVSYFQYGAKQRFLIDGTTHFSELKYNSLKASFLPFIFKIGGKKFKMSVGAGIYGTYALNRTITATPALENPFPEAFLEDIIYGGQGQIGLYFNRWIINVNAFNSLNHLVPNSESEVRTRGTSTTLTYMFGKR